MGVWVTHAGPKILASGKGLGKGPATGKKVSEIRKQYPGIIEIVENVTLPITVLRCDYSKESHNNYLFTIFHRLNSGGKKLTNQEIRNCKVELFQALFYDVIRSDYTFLIGNVLH